MTFELLELCEVANVLRTAQRVGHEFDSPEGARYIKISDTLAKYMSGFLIRYENDLHARRAGDSAHIRLMKTELEALKLSRDTGNIDTVTTSKNTGVKII